MFSNEYIFSLYTVHYKKASYESPALPESFLHLTAVALPTADLAPSALRCDLCRTISMVETVILEPTFIREAENGR
jgi:hypothetical protein